jgi:uncharacterized protein (TIGR02594 family)
MANFKIVASALNVRAAPSLEAPKTDFARQDAIGEQLPGSELVSEASAKHPTNRTWMWIVDSEFGGWASLKHIDLNAATGRWQVGTTTNLREDPRLDPTNANVVGELPVGSSVPEGPMVVESLPAAAGVRRWVGLKFANGTSGWCSMGSDGDLIDETNDDPTPTDAVGYRVKATFLNIRAEPDLDSSVVGVLNQGDSVQAGRIVVTPERSWVEIDTPVAGFVSMKWLRRSTSDGDTPYEIARGEEGIKETPGRGDNPEVVKYLKSCTSLNGSSAQSNDETAWCSAFVNWCVEQAGMEGTESAMARSWRRWGKAISDPVEGCIVVLSRGSNPAHGHVGFFVDERPGEIKLLGGNQRDQVKESWFSKSRVLRNGYRVPR